MIPLSPQIIGSDTQYIAANPLSGNVSLMDEKEYTVLCQFPHAADEDEDTVSQLKDAGYLTRSTPEEEKELMKKRYEAQKTPYDPVASIILTYQCNLRCTYCFVDHLFARKATWLNTVIDEKTIDAAFTSISSIPALEPLEVISFFGGEPFLPSTICMAEYVLEKGSKREYSFHANTNGYYLKLFVPLLSQHKIYGLGVTLDGCRTVHDARRKRIDGRGTFDQIVEGIDTALDAGITIGVRINTDLENITHLSAFKDWIEEHGWAHQKNITFEITPVLPREYNTPPSVLTYAEVAQKIIDLKKELPSLFETMYYSWEYLDEGFLARTILDGTELKPRPFYCSAHYETYVFDPFGDLYCCSRAVGDRRFAIGQFVPELQFNETYNQWRSRDVLSIPKCKDCSLALVCGGGCAYEAYLQCHTICEGFCEQYKAFLKYGLPLLVRGKMRMRY